VEDQVPVTVIHFYDVRTRETLCGLRGFEHRSTKHPHGVTCPACVRLLDQRSAPEGAPGEDVGGGPVASA
jgi:hypothetical protein